MKTTNNSWKIILFTSMLFISCTPSTKIYNMSDFGINPDTNVNISPLLKKAVTKIGKATKGSKKIILSFSPGRYDFHEKGSFTKNYYISNHDQSNPKKVGLAIENMCNIIIDGQGSNFIFHGTMLPIAIINSKHCSIKNLHIDFENPHIAQIQIKENTPESGTTFQTAYWVKCKINKQKLFETHGENWKYTPHMAIAFEENTKHLVYRTSDIYCELKDIRKLGNRTYQAPHWNNPRLIPGTVLVMRTWDRPTPGIFLSESYDSKLENVQVHYSQGMGLLAQMCENITLDKFSVCLRGKNDKRYFTTQADATHFSGCKGKIISKNGLYEGMMDDAINVHGTYLKVVKRLDNHTIIGRYMHPQTWGFKWGAINDTIQFINANKMDVIKTKHLITSIEPRNNKGHAKGAHEFVISFVSKIEPFINDNNNIGIENLSNTPSIYFANNTIRNNRARGSLFSTPRKTIIEMNTFDHTSGSAILLCGDCNGWYETGACREVIIRNNKFINSLTNLFQFTEAIISIYPEIPDLDNQKSYFHGQEEGGVFVENNLFETFDKPIIYAKSLNGLTFIKNTIKTNHDYPAFHSNNKRFFLQHVKNVLIKENTFEGGFNNKQDIRKE